MRATEIRAHCISHAHERTQYRLTNVYSRLKRLTKTLLVTLMFLLILYREFGVCCVWRACFSGTLIHPNIHGDMNGLKRIVRLFKIIFENCLWPFHRLDFHQMHIFFNGKLLFIDLLRKMGWKIDQRLFYGSAMKVGRFFHQNQCDGIHWSQICDCHRKMTSRSHWNQFWKIKLNQIIETL